MDGLVRKFLPGLDPSRHARVCRWLKVLADGATGKWKKPTLLVDGPNTFLLKKLPQLRRLLEAVNQQYSCHLRLHMVVTDVFVVNVTFLEDSLQRRLDSPDEWAIINVSRDLPCPVIGGPDKTALAKRLLDSLKTGKEALMTEDGENLTTIYGVLLDYPVVFYFEGGDTCLANEHLCNCQVVTSDSFVIQSFSFPSTLQEQIDPLVQKWFESRWALSSDITFEKKLVTLDTIAL